MTSEEVLRGKVRRRGGAFDFFFRPLVGFYTGDNSLERLFEGLVKELSLTG